MLEQRLGLDINDLNHIWLLHHLFLATLNRQLGSFQSGWNSHPMRLSDQPARSPEDMFFFDMLVLGERGDPLPQQIMDRVDNRTHHIYDDIDAQHYGVDWEELGNGGDEMVQRPEVMNEVALESPNTVVEAEVVSALDTRLSVMDRGMGEEEVGNLWFEALSFMRNRVHGF